MKAKILKELGLTEDQFYAKYPSQEAFENSKKGKAVLAKCGIKVTKAQAGLTQDSGFMQNLTGGEGAVGALKNLGGENPLQKVSDIVSGFKAQKQAVASAKQNMQVMDWMEQAAASNSQNEQFNLQQAREKTYVRPEDNILTGEELFPMQGVGTNVLAKRGKTIKAEDGTFLGSTGQQWGDFGKGILKSGGNETIKALNLAPDDMGGQIGSDILGTVGSATGIPGMDVVGKVAGKFIGDALDRSDTRIAKYNRASDRSINNMMGMNMGAYNRKQFGGNLENGGSIPTYSQGGNIKTYGDGGITPLSDNPYGGEMGMINGPSHDNGGVDMEIYGENIEAEGGEPIMKMEDGGTTMDDSMVILGNLKPARHLIKSAESFTGEKLKGNKYKSIGKNIGKIESGLTDKLEKLDQTMIPNPLRRLDIIENNSKKHMSKVYDTKLKKLQVIKEGFAKAQEAQNEENETTAKYGKTIKAQTGVTKDNPTLPPNTFRTEEEAEAAGFYYDPDQGKLVKEIEPPTKGFSHTIKGTPGTSGMVGAASKVIGKDKKQMSNEAWKAYLEKETPEKKAQRLKNEVSRGIRSKEILAEINTPGTEDTTVKFDDFPGIYEYADIVPLEESKKEEKNIFKKLPWFDFMNLKGTDAEGFNNAQLLPEVWAMANNKLEPVQSQKYNPRLRTPYDISLQDQLNENTASTRSTERLLADNPGALANLKSQEYLANSSVLGNQFRMNQQFKDQIYGGNLNTLNDADLKNLATADLQYTRQAQAASNTKATNFEAIKSMTDKRLKHNLENQTLRVWENMYDYRFDPAGRAQYRGPNADFSSWETVGSEPINQELYEYEKGPDGKLMRKKKTKTEPTKQPSLSNRPYTAMNGSIVKKLKKFK